MVGTRLVFYRCDLSEDGTVFYRSVVDRMEMYLLFYGQGNFFRTRPLQLAMLNYFTDSLDCHVFCRQDEILDLL